LTPADYLEDAQVYSTPTGLDGYSTPGAHFDAVLVHDTALAMATDSGNDAMPNACVDVV